MAKPTNFGRKGSTYSFLNEMADTGYRPQKGTTVTKLNNAGHKVRNRTDQRVLRNARMTRVADAETEARLSTNIRHKVW